MPTGATVAALTTSLPETPGGERNWDYRYTWMRDTTFTLQALHYLNLDWEADEFMQFVADLEPNPDGGLQIMYGIDGRRDLTESTRDELSGYEGARPVRLGNGAFDQRQNDVFGAVLDSLLLHTRRSKHLPRRLWPLVQSQAAGAIAAWREPDQGIWEARGKPQHYVSSKLMGWVALDRAAKLAAIRDDDKLEKEWAATAEEIKADILAHGVSDRGVLRQHYDTDALDASTLLAPLFGFLPGTDERMRNTVTAISEELTENGFVLRYRTDETDDGLSGKEGTFLICSFWLVSAFAAIGEMEQATEPDGAAAPDRLAARPVRRGVRGRARPAPRQLPAGVLPPGPDPGRRADHPDRLPGGAVAVTGRGESCARRRAGRRRLRAHARRRGRRGGAGRPQRLPPVPAAALPGGDLAAARRGHRPAAPDDLPRLPDRRGASPADVDEVDPGRPDPAPGRRRTLTGSHLVMAAGARPNFFGVPGAAEHAFPLYSVADAERLRLPPPGAAARRPRRRAGRGRRRLDVVVVGGGPTGVEIDRRARRADAARWRRPGAIAAAGADHPGRPRRRAARRVLRQVPRLRAQAS